jgi:hypothetical protein
MSTYAYIYTSTRIFEFRGFEVKVEPARLTFSGDEHVSARERLIVSTLLDSTRFNSICRICRSNLVYDTPAPRERASGAEGSLSLSLSTDPSRWPIDPWARPEGRTELHHMEPQLRLHCPRGPWAYHPDWDAWNCYRRYRRYAASHRTAGGGKGPCGLPNNNGKSIICVVL